MSDKTVLIIDDSATIRRLVDSELTPAGYRVLMAATAEDGIRVAAESTPDLILLDHQLPGTTGQEVCFQLLEQENLKNIPVVASSTLRKKAYAEYVDFPNVVDMLPKPYSGDLLITTVENALSTAAMVVQSQSQGTAVPEVIDEVSASDLCGTFDCFGMREVVDLLNNGNKCGVMEVELEGCRVWIYVNEGRIQAVTGAGIDPAEISKNIPESLGELAPVVKFTMGGRRCSEIDGIVELLDNKVLDPRLLRKLLRIQGAILLRRCFTMPLQGFRFEANQIAPSLFRKLPLDSSLLALLVEGALTCDASEITEIKGEQGFVRRAIRGQNLDRTGLSGPQMKLMGMLSEPISVSEVASKLDWSVDEATRVLHGFELAELVQQQTIRETINVMAVATGEVQHLQKVFTEESQQITGKIVRDWLALKLMLRRKKIAAVIVDCNDPSAGENMARLKNDSTLDLCETLWIGIGDGDPNEIFDLVIGDDFDGKLLVKALVRTSCPESVMAGELCQVPAVEQLTTME